MTPPPQRNHLEIDLWHLTEDVWLILLLTSKVHHLHNHWFKPNVPTSNFISQTRWLGEHSLPTNGTQSSSIYSETLSINLGQYSLLSYHSHQLKPWNQFLSSSSVFFFGNPLMLDNSHLTHYNQQVILLNQTNNTTSIFLSKLTSCLINVVFVVSSMRMDTVMM